MGKCFTTQQFSDIKYEPEAKKTHKDPVFHQQNKNMNFNRNVVIGFCNIFIYSKHVEITDNNYDATAEFFCGWFWFPVFLLLLLFFQFNFLLRTMIDGIYEEK